MNLTEQRYADYLNFRKIAGEIVWWRFHAINLRLADNTYYAPDFAVLMATGAFEIHEVKGFWMDDAKVKIKVAADLYPFIFRAVHSLPKKQGGGWREEEF